MGIRVVKLFSGEEVIARVEETLSGNKYASPRVIQMMQTQQGMGAGLVPFIMSAPDETITINPNAIVVELNASKQIEDAYLQQTSKLDLTTKF